MREIPNSCTRLFSEYLQHCKKKKKKKKTPLKQKYARTSNSLYSPFMNNGILEFSQWEKQKRNTWIILIIKRWLRDNKTFWKTITPFFTYKGIKEESITLVKKRETIEQPKNFWNLEYFLFWSRPAFTCSKLTIETLEQGVKYVQS